MFSRRAVLITRLVILKVTHYFYDSCHRLTDVNIRPDENQSYEDLIRYTKERFNVEEIVYKWSAQLYESVDGLPYIGRSHFRKHVYLATGFFGDGISLGSIAAK
jgi:glycine/D-amino acid oxidase-like deaminating enzyme